MTTTKIKTRWSAAQSRKVRKRLIVEGKLVLKTPAHFGNGDSDTMTDMYLLRDSLEPEHPLLPGASLTGALRAYLQAVCEGHRVAEQSYGHIQKITPVSLLFGGSKGDDEGKQSPLIIEDAPGQLPKRNSVAVASERRTHVKLDGKTRTALDKHLFNMELWPAGTTFALRFELLITECTRREKKFYSSDAEKELALKQALLSALHGLESGEITLGARKQRGLGQIAMREWRLREYDLKEPTELVSWLRQRHEPLSTKSEKKLDALLKASLLNDSREMVHLTATFALDGSLLIRDGEPAVFERNGELLLGPDMVHLHSFSPKAGEKRPILPGTSVAGALRARATRIVRLFAEEETADSFIADLFGPDMENRPDPKASNLRVAETRIKEVVSDLVQNRIKIDRFTGGAFETALFSEQPLWGILSKDGVEITLHLLKDASLPKLATNEYVYERFKESSPISEEATSKKAFRKACIETRFNAQIGLLLLLLKDLWTGDLPLGGEISVGRGRLKGHSATLNINDQSFIFQPDDDQNITIHAQTENPHTHLQTYVDALHNYLKEEIK